MRALLVFLSLSAAAKAEEIKCMGPAVGEANHYIVFLHGAGLEAQDLRDIPALQELSKKKKIRFALPKATLPCNSDEYKGKKCWMTGIPAPDSHNATMKIIEEAAATCFRGQDYGLLGFSAGGFFVTMLRNFCVPNKFTKMIAMGFAIKTSPRISSMRLEGCDPRLNMVIGNKDPYLKQVKETYANFKDRGADVKYEEYSGAHDFKSEPLLHFFD